MPNANGLTKPPQRTKLTPDAPKMLKLTKPPPTDRTDTERNRRGGGRRSGRADFMENWGKRRGRGRRFFETGGDAAGGRAAFIKTGGMFF